MTYREQRQRAQQIPRAEGAGLVVDPVALIPDAGTIAEAASISMANAASGATSTASAAVIAQLNTTAAVVGSAHDRRTGIER